MRTRPKSSDQINLLLPLLDMHYLTIMFVISNYNLFEVLTYNLVI